jgi:hypothetical protein
MDMPGRRQELYGLPDAPGVELFQQTDIVGLHGHSAAQRVGLRIAHQLACLGRITLRDAAQGFHMDALELIPAAVAQKLRQSHQRGRLHTGLGSHLAHGRYGNVGRKIEQIAGAHLKLRRHVGEIALYACRERLNVLRREVWVAMHVWFLRGLRVAHMPRSPAQGKRGGAPSLIYLLKSI